MGSGRSVVVAFLLGIILAAFLCEVADGAEFTPVMAWTGAAPSGACAGNRVSVIASTGAHYCCVTGTWTACGGSSTIPWANVTGTPTTLSGYGVTAVAWSAITATPTTLVGYGITDAAPKASPIFTGTVTAPTFSGALSGNAATASALLSDPSDCTGNNFSLGINASGTAQCAQPSFSNLSGTATAAQIPAATAVALGGVKGFTGLTFVTGDLSLTASNITSVLGATSVQNATNAGTATNATQLGGVAAASYLQASTAATTYAPIGSKYLTMGSDATLSAEVAVPTCSGTDKLTSNGTAITCATDQTVAYTLPDATASVKGGIQLSGDLGGTAAAPTVPGLAGKAPTASPTFTGTVSAAAATTTGMLTGNQITSTTGQIFAGTNNALLLRSYVPSDASSPFTANIIDTNLTMTNAGSKLLAINNGSFLKSYFDKDGNFSGNAASATTAADSAKLGGTAAASYLLSSTAASTYAPIASPTFTGTVTAPTFSGALSGNASTASALAANPADCTGNNFSLGIDATGAAQCAQPAFSNLSGSIAATQIIAPTTTTFGGVKAKTCTGSDKVSAIGADGVPVCTADQGGSSALVLPSGLTQYGVQQIPFDATIANGTNYGYLILAKAYVSGSQPDSEVTGTITLVEVRVPD